MSVGGAIVYSRLVTINSWCRVTEHTRSSDYYYYYYVLNPASGCELDSNLLAAPGRHEL